MKDQSEMTIARQNRRGIAFLIPALLLIFSFLTAAPGLAQQIATPSAASTQVQKLESLQDVVAKQAALVTEFDVNGLKVLVKKREGSLTVAAGLFIKGGSRNITAENAGIESLMLDVATEASVSYPRERLRSELSRTGTVI